MAKETIGAVFGAIVSAFMVLSFFFILATTPSPLQPYFAQIENGIVGSFIAVLILGAAVILAFVIWVILKNIFD